jgi:hypothetical protein
MRVLAPVVLCALSSTALADTPTNTAELGEEIRDLTSDNYRAITVGKLMTFNVGAKCWAKLKQDSRPVDLISTSTRYVAELAKSVTGDEWATLEGSGTTEKAKNRSSIEATVEAFKSTFSLTVSVDGDDCDDGWDPLWLQYEMHALQYMAANVPKSKQAHITITVQAKAKKFSGSVDKTGTKFTFVAPKDVAPKKWQEQMEAVFEKAARK